MSTVQQFNDTGHIRNQILPSGTVVGDLLYRNNAGWHLRTSISDAIDGYVAVLDSGVNTGVVSVSNGVTTWKGGNAVGQIVYEDTTNPSKVTITPGGKKIGVIKGGMGGILGSYEGDSLFIECFSVKNDSADNGLSVGADGKIELGNEVGGTSATLHSDREIPMDGNSIFYGHTGTVAEGPSVIQADGTQAVGHNHVVQGPRRILNAGGSYNGNLPDTVGDDIINARSLDGYGLKNIKYVQSKNGLINTGDDAVIEYIYPQDSVGNNIVNHVSRGDGFIRNIDGTLNRNINLIGSSDNGIYVLGDHGNWLSRTDYVPGTGLNPPILSTSTTEPMAIDITTGQVGRMIQKYYTVSSISNVPDFVATNNSWVDMNMTYIINPSHNGAFFVKIQFDAMTFDPGYKAVGFVRLLVDGSPVYQFPHGHNFLNNTLMTGSVYTSNDAPFERIDDAIIILTAGSHTLSYEFINFNPTVTITNSESQLIVHGI